MNYTNAETAKILEFAGVWKADEKCALSWGLCPHYEFRAKIFDDWTLLPHSIPMPALEGDFRDVVAMKCLRRLHDIGVAIDLINVPKVEWNEYIVRTGECWEMTAQSLQSEALSRVRGGTDPTAVIFAAVLAYLKEQEK